MYARTALAVSGLLFSASAMAQTVTTSGACPGIVTISGTGFTPNNSVIMLTGTLGGNFVVPSGPCAGAAIALGSPKVRNKGNATAAGDRTIQPNLPVGACGLGVAMLDLATCTASPAVPINASCVIPNNQIASVGPDPALPVMANPVFVGITTAGNMDAGLRTDFTLETIAGAFSAGVIFDLYDAAFNLMCSVSYDLTPATVDPAVTATDAAGNPVLVQDPTTLAITGGGFTDCAKVDPAVWGTPDLRVFFATADWSISHNPMSADMVAQLQPLVGATWAADWDPFVFAEAIGNPGFDSLEANYAFQYDRTCEEVQVDAAGFLVGPLPKPNGPISEFYQSTAFYVFNL